MAIYELDLKIEENELINLDFEENEGLDMNIEAGFIVPVIPKNYGLITYNGSVITVS